jgi:hypothetical protein
MEPQDSQCSLESTTNKINYRYGTGNMEVQVVEALRYKSKGHEFDSPWGH